MFINSQMKIQNASTLTNGEKISYSIVVYSGERGLASELDVQAPTDNIKWLSHHSNNHALLSTHYIFSIITLSHWLILTSLATQNRVFDAREMGLPEVSFRQSNLGNSFSLCWPLELLMYIPLKTLEQKCSRHSRRSPTSLLCLQSLKSEATNSFRIICLFFHTAFECLPPFIQHLEIEY